jgi:hypothetical protein
MASGALKDHQTINTLETISQPTRNMQHVWLKGDIVLANQAGSQLIFVHNPGTPQQSLTSLPVGTQLDDTVWATSANGRLLLADGTTNAIWQITGTFSPGTVYTETPDDSSVVGLLATLSLSSGTLTPVGIGFKKPTGLAFIPSS